MTITWKTIEELLHAAPGDFSVCVWNGQGEQLYGYGEQVVRAAASLIKVPLAMAVVDAYPAIDLDTQIVLDEAARVEGDGSFDTAPAGTVKTIRELIGHALIESDNTASNLLIEQVGFQRVNQLLESLNLNTRMRRKFMDLDAVAAGRDNTTTAVDMCAIFLQLQQSRYALVLGLLKQAIGKGKIEAGLTPDVVVAHKVGDLPHVEHDVGIVFGPSQAYILAVLGIGLPEPDSGKRVIATVSRLVWELMVGAA